MVVANVRLGIGVISHGIKTFGIGTDWEERQIKNTWKKKKKTLKMEITMENQDKFNEIAYKKHKKVKDIRTYYYMVLGYLAVGYFIVSQKL